MRYVLAITLSLCGVLAGAQELTPGGEIRLKFKQAEQPAVIWRPSGETPPGGWPVLVYLHGTSGAPETATPRRYAGDEHYIVLALPYLERGEFRGTVAEQIAAVAAQRELMTQLLIWLKSREQLASDGVVICGVSKGGWYASIMAEDKLDGVRGVCILLAGRAIRTRPLAKNALGATSQVYIGVGETDGNNFHGRRAAELYRSREARVTFEEFAGVGHQLPPESARLSAWFAVLAGAWDPRDPAKHQALADWARGTYDAAMAQPTPAERYAALRDMDADPRLRLCPEVVRKAVNQQLEALTDTPPLAAEWQAERAYMRLARRESYVQYLDEIEAIVKGYKELAKRYPDTDFGRRAVEQGERAEQWYRRSAAAAEAAAARQPKAKPRRGPSMNIDGEVFVPPGGMVVE